MKKTSVNSFLNPGYSGIIDDWMLCDDCFAGERVVKSRGELYLPKTEGQMADHEYGARRYEAYKDRANFFNYFSSCVTSMLGMLHREPPEAAELPEKLMILKNTFTLDGEDISSALRRINFFQLVYGRAGILADVPEWDESPDSVPRTVVYPPHRILDWESDPARGLVFLLLDESGDVYDASAKRRFFEQRLRLCALDIDGEYFSMLLSPAEFASLDLAEKPSGEYYPEVRGKRLAKIPFAFANVAGNSPAIGVPPLLPLANVCLALYRGEADYRHALFMQAQSTLFLKGFPLDAPPMMGAGNYIHTESPDASGSFLEISGAGLSEMRQAQEFLHDMARNMGMALNDFGSAESGEALKTRLSVKNAMLRAIAASGGAAVGNILRIIAEWCGEDAGKVVFSPNMDFAEGGVDASEIRELWNAKREGLPVSGRSIHDWLRKNDYTDVSFDDEKKELRRE